MTNLMQYVVGGVATGSLYALVALGIALLYRSSRVLNFAHGDQATFATFVAFTLMGGGFRFHVNLPFGVAVPVSLVGGGGGRRRVLLLDPASGERGHAARQDRHDPGVCAPVERRDAVRLGRRHAGLPLPLSVTKVYRLGGVVVSQVDLGTIIIGLVLMAAMYVLVQRTKVGLAMRAVVAGRRLPRRRWGFRPGKSTRPHGVWPRPWVAPRGSCSPPSCTSIPS